ncbi:MAG: division/cell wall cluster transcriptional repressor MraZ [Actinobacteria bacterium]|nr:division/cell wall cluster transcriptional repressor MraZ [Actinomycetota bacterium]
MDFSGEQRQSLDKKWRVVLPSRFRGEFEEYGIVMAKGIEECILVYPKNEWEKFADRLQGSQLTEEGRMIDRLLFGGADTTSTVDKQGRVVIPQSLRDHAGLSREVVVVGARKKLEIWDKDKWEEHIRIAKEKYAEIARSLELGFTKSLEPEKLGT